MAENTFVVFPLGAWQLDKLKDGSLMLTLRYVEAKEEPKTQLELDKSLRSLRVRMTATRGAELGSELWKEAQALLDPKPN